MNIVTSTNILYERAYEPYIAIEDSIKACAQAGYKELDIGFVELAASSKQFQRDDWKAEILYFKELAHSLGLKFVQSHATIYDFCNPEADHGVGELLFKRSIEAAALLDVPVIVAHPSSGVKNGRITEETAAQNADFFRRQADYARQYGMKIALENMWGRTREGVRRYAITANELLELLGRIERENVGVCWDVEHASIEKLDQDSEIRKLGDQLIATHISDETGHNNIHILPYTGFVDWKTVLKALAAVRYSGAFAFEIQHYLPHMPMELVPEAMRLSVTVGNQMIKMMKNYMVP